MPAIGAAAQALTALTGLVHLGVDNNNLRSTVHALTAGTALARLTN